MAYKFGHKKKAMIQALEKSFGIVCDACAAVKISRDTHYRWMKEDENYSEAVTSLEDLSLDFAESKLLKQIEALDTAATIFYLKTKGKKRGYIEHSTIDLTSKGEKLSLSRDEVMAELELIRKRREEKE